MEETKTDQDIWKIKVDKAIETFSFLQDNIHSSIVSINDNLANLEFKSLELSKELLTISHLNDVNESLFSPYEDTKKKIEESNLKDELSDVQIQLPKLREELEHILKKEQEYSLVRECLDYLKTIISDERYNQEKNIEKEKNVNSTDDNNSTNEGIKILETQELERQRIARDLHDSTIQNLTNLMHKTELCIKLLEMDEIRARLELATLIVCIRNIINDMREIIYNLKPMTIQDLGLVPAIERFIKKYKEQNHIQVIFDKTNETNKVLPVINLTLYRIVQEACNNIAKYANATICKIGLIHEENQIILTVEDNGVGMQLETVNTKDMNDNCGFGLSIMRERALLLSGSFNISSKKNKGTKIIVTIPYHE